MSDEERLNKRYEKLMSLGAFSTIEQKQEEKEAQKSNTITSFFDRK